LRQPFPFDPLPTGAVRIRQTQYKRRRIDARGASRAGPSQTEWTRLHYGGHCYPPERPPQDTFAIICAELLTNQGDKAPTDYSPMSNSDGSLLRYRSSRYQSSRYQSSRVAESRAGLRLPSREHTCRAM